MGGLTFIPAILLAAGAWLVGWGVRRRRALGGPPDEWQRVVGTVVAVGDGAGQPPRIEYRTPDGRRLRVPGPLGTPFTVEQELAVLIDPRDPSRARLTLTQQDAARVTLQLIGAGLALLVLGAITAFAFL